MGQTSDSSGNKIHAAYRQNSLSARAPFRWGLTALLLALCVFLLIPVSYKPDPLVQRILEYSPVKQAQEYYNKSGAKAAFDFVNFYESLPGVQPNPALNEIREKAAEERSSWTYMGREIGAALLGLEHHEQYAKWAKTAVNLVPYGKDIHAVTRYANEMIQEWRNYSSGKEIDMLHLGVATLGLLEVGIGLLPGDNEMINKLKAQTNTLLDSLKMMNAELRAAATEVLELAFKSLEKSGLNEETDSQSLLDMIKEKSGQFMGILDQAETGLNYFQGLVNLEQKNKSLVPIVVNSSSDFRELDKNSEVAGEIAKLNPDVLLYGGSAALQAAERLKAQGSFNIKILEDAMKYGVPGLNAVGIIPVSKLEKDIGMAKNPSGWYLRLPAIVTFIIILASFIGLIFIWLPLLRKQMQPSGGR